VGPPSPRFQLTIHSGSAERADVDRDVRATRHPSEDLPYLLSRVLALLLTTDALVSDSSESKEKEGAGAGHHGHQH